MILLKSRMHVRNIWKGFIVLQRTTLAQEAENERLIELINILSTYPLPHFVTDLLVAL